MKKPHDRSRPSESVDSWSMDRDPLLSFLARELALLPDAPGLEDPRFLRWLSERLEERELLSLGLVRRREAAAFADRALSRLAARRVRIELFEGAAERVSSGSDERLSAAMEQAARHACAATADLSVAAGSGSEWWDQRCDEWVRLPPGVRSGKHLVVRVSGDSMEPLLHGGDVLLVRVGPEAARDTAIVARVEDGTYVVKRVGDVTTAHAMLLSVNPAYPPIRLWRNPYVVLGTVVGRWCRHRPPAPPTASSV